MIGERPGEKFHFNMHTFSATGAFSMLRGDVEPRTWVKEMALRTFAFQDGQVPGLAYQTWSNADNSLASNYGTAWLQAITAKNTDGSNFTRGATGAAGQPLNNFFTDIPGYAAIRWAIGGPHRYELIQHDVSTQGIRSGLNIAFQNPVMTAAAVRVLEPLSYQNGVGDEVHPDTSDPDGMARFMVQVGYGVLQGLGFAPAQPVLDQWSYDAGTLTIGSSAGAITTDRIARGGTLPAGQPAVENVFRNGTINSNVSISGGNIVVTGLSDGDLVAVGLGGIGTGSIVGDDDVTAVVDRTWLDYPIVGVGTAALEGLPVRGLQIVPPGVIPAVALPADPNTNANLLPANAVAFDPAVWSQQEGAGWVFGDGVATHQGTLNLDLFTVDFALTDLDAARGGALEFRFVPTSPDGGVASIIAEVTASGGGNNIIGVINSVPVTMGTPMVIACTAVPADRTTVRLRFRRRPTSSNKLVIQAISLKRTT